jgi:hypothetical protein
MVEMADIWRANGPCSGGTFYECEAGCKTLLTIVRNQITGWCGLIRVDGATYTWMGLPGSTTVTQTAFEYTSTKSIFTMDVGGKVEMNITFMSPITPDDFKRQSLIFSYLNVEVSSLDGNDHDVQVYADISAGKLARTRKTKSP